MGRREMALIFMMFCSTMATTSSLQEILPTESNYHQKTNTEKHGQDGVTNRIGRRYNANAISASHGAGHGNAAGGGGGDSHGNAAGGGGGDSGGSRPYTGGGSAVIPIYAAGSAHHGQGRPRNAGNRQENNMGLLVAAVFAAIAHL